MNNTLLNKAGKKLFERNLAQYTPVDPLYETYTDSRGRQKRRKRELPPGLSARDAKVLKSVKRRAHYLDKGFNLCGLRFGWTFIIGIIPGAGDVADASLNYLLVVRKARQAEIPSWLLRRMLVNNAVSACAGLIPVAGDVVLAMYKANSRNAALLEEYLRIRGEEFIKLQESGNDVVAASAASKKEEVAPGVTKGDTAQVKPGAGRATGEVVDGTMAGGIDRVTSGKSRNFMPRWGNGGKKKTHDQARPREGKFIEDIGSGSPSTPPT